LRAARAHARRAWRRNIFNGVMTSRPIAVAIVRGLAHSFRLAALQARLTLLGTD
jgi:hypothetical protein